MSAPTAHLTDIFGAMPLDYIQNFSAMKLTFCRQLNAAVLIQIFSAQFTIPSIIHRVDLCKDRQSFATTLEVLLDSF
jgi:hypothetical protein